MRNSFTSIRPGVKSACCSIPVATSTSPSNAEELNAQIAAIKKHQEEEAATNKKRQEEEAAKKKQEESKPPTRAQLLSKALKQCKKEPKNKRAQCIAEATKKYGHKTKKKTGKK